MLAGYFRLILLLCLACTALASQWQEILFEFAPARVVGELFASRYTAVGFTVHPYMNGFLLRPIGEGLPTGLPPRRPSERDVSALRDQILEIKHVVALFDRPAEAGAGNITRQFDSGYVSSGRWITYLQYRFPDLVVTAQTNSFLATGTEGQLRELGVMVDALRP